MPIGVWGLTGSAARRGLPECAARGTLTAVTAIQPELWVDQGLAAVAFYQQAFGAQVLHRVGEGEDIVAQLGVDDAVFWIAAAGDSPERLVPRKFGAASARILLLVSDPEAVHSRAIAAGAVEKSAVGLEHGWQVGRVIDPFGHEWEIGKPVIDWPPTHTR
jgi:PhnB protein